MNTCVDGLDFVGVDGLVVGGSEVEACVCGVCAVWWVVWVDFYFHLVLLCVFPYELDGFIIDWQDHLTASVSD